MKNKELLLLLLFYWIGIQANAQTPYQRSKVTEIGNKVIICKGFVEKNLKVGMWKYYHEKGTVLRKEGVYKKGKRDGKWTFYNYLGVVERTEYWKNGSPTGTATKYYNNAAIKAKKVYPKGKNKLAVKDVYKIELTDEASIEADEQLDLEYEIVLERSLVDEYIRYSPEGKQQRKGAYKGQLKSGAWTYYHKNEGIKKEGKYEEGKREGIWTTFDKGGTLYATGNYLANFKEGEWKHYYPMDQHRVHYEGLIEPNVLNGRLSKEMLADSGRILKEVIHYKKGIREGEYTFLNDEGELKIKGMFKEGKEEGKWDYYYVSGELKHQYTFQKGQLTGVALTYYKSGQLKFQEEYKDGFLTGKRLTFYEDGKQAAIEFYRIDESDDLDFPFNPHFFLAYSTKYIKWTGGQTINRDKTWKQFHPNGKLETEMTYVDGKQTGQWRSYSLDGLLLREENYLNGALSGRSRVYYDNGKMSRDGNYKNGQRDGLWKWYTGKGVLHSEVSYKDDLKEGGEKVYYDSGELKEKSSYQKGELIGKVKQYSIDGKVKK